MNENEIERVKRKKKLVVSALLQVLDSDSDEDLITMVCNEQARKRRKPRVAIKNYVENVVLKMNENEIERVKRKKKLVVSALLQVLDSDSDEDLITMVCNEQARKRRKPRVAIKNYVENVVSCYTDDIKMYTQTYRHSHLTTDVSGVPGVEHLDKYPSVLLAVAIGTVSADLPNKSK
ncbi:hypothetical protein FQA39_LY04747 [Lamprigera yunnana]|nr:hypothetical protein FQA39_LY04747 [Lamprigera yunnana]